LLIVAAAGEAAGPRAAEREVVLIALTAAAPRIAAGVVAPQGAEVGAVGVHEQLDPVGNAGPRTGFIADAVAHRADGDRQQLPLFQTLDTQPALVRHMLGMVTPLHDTLRWGEPKSHHYRREMPPLSTRNSEQARYFVTAGQGWSAAPE